MWPRAGGHTPLRKLAYVQGFHPWGWTIVTGVYADDLDTARLHIAMTLAGLVIWRLGRSVARPVQNLVLATDWLSRGEFDSPIPGHDRADELGTLARALEVLKANSMARVQLEQKAAEERAAKDRRHAAMKRFTADFAAVISGVLGRLAGAARTMSETAREMTDATEQTRASAARTVDSAATSSRDLSTMAAATAELSASVGEIARQVAHATAATQDAVRRASDSNAKFVQLAEMAERIGAVGGVISAIAGQTNLLALNATIEAARAGETGKSFAVVAGEGKALATQTARATADIIDSVSSIRTATRQTVASMDEVCAAIGDMDTVSAAIAAAIEQQNAATREISANVHSVALAGDRTAADMTELAKIADATGAMSRDVLASSDELGAVADTLRAEVDHFLRAMTQDNADQWRYERVPGRNAPATLIAGPARRIPAVIDNLSRCGIALRCTFIAETGVEVQVALPGSGGPVAGRAVRCGADLVAIAFRQDEATLSRAEAAVDAIASGNSWTQAA
ncbi:methyl-accepting chemotaxis protein [Rhodopila globiformis]|uniref:Methyl-accepting transducer domain-containing protein n=1 Tax=Rhodopila globiformis TaxID=1071 RepID=A0A2S6NKJ0_RHOGL|nr:methyl-accepting chemotaxis protein [Rhodopila globiformis]PPQ35512.1 hypothetical protein CCS01_07470 [Rhodopila globiformis]